MALGRTFTGTPGQPSSSTGGPNEIKADIDSIMKALNEAFAILGITLAPNGLPDPSAKTFPLFIDLASIVLGVSGSELIGYPDAVDNNVYKIIQRILAAGSGTLPPANSITNNNLVADIKIGSLLLLNTTEKGTIVGAINEVKADVDIAVDDAGAAYLEALLVGTYESASGTVNAYEISYPLIGTFAYTAAFTKKRVCFMPNLTNTASATININSNGAKAIKKADSTGAFVNLEEGDIKKNVPCELIWDYANDFFIYAPKGGSNVKSIQRGSTSITLGSTSVDVSITGTDVSKSFLAFTITAPSGGNDSQLCTGELINSTTIRFARIGTTGALNIEWQVTEFNNVKSKQSGTLSTTSETNNITISAVSENKCIYFISVNNNYTSEISSVAKGRAKLTSSTNLSITRETTLGYTSVFKWQVIEFN